MEIKFGYNAENKKSDWIGIKFYNLTTEQIEHLHKAEYELRSAGVSFDTGYDFEEKRRDWEFDWSLKGAIVVAKENKGGDEKQDG